MDAGESKGTFEHSDLFPRVAAVLWGLRAPEYLTIRKWGSVSPDALRLKQALPLLLRDQLLCTAQAPL